MNLLRDVPDLGEWERLEGWAAALEARLGGLSGGTGAPSPAELVPLDVGTLVTAGPPVQAPAFRRAVVATWAADQACYGGPDERVDLARLLYVMQLFPAGFRLWFAPCEGALVPVGYTGWYPVSARTFETLARHPGDITHRGQMVPLPRIPAAGSWIYVFNYSMVAALHGSGCTRRMLGALRDDLDAARPAGLCAITVSPDGARVAEGFGMARAGTVAVGDPPEHAYVGRR